MTLNLCISSFYLLGCGWYSLLELRRKRNKNSWNVTDSVRSIMGWWFTHNLSCQQRNQFRLAFDSLWTNFDTTLKKFQINHFPWPIDLSLCQELKKATINYKFLSFFNWLKCRINLTNQVKRQINHTILLNLFLRSHTKPWAHWHWWRKSRSKNEKSIAIKISGPSNPPTNIRKIEQLCLLLTMNDKKTSSTISKRC